MSDDMQEGQGWHGWGDAQVAADQTAVKGDNGFFKMEAREDPYIVRFLPATMEEESAIRVVYQHYIEFPDQSSFKFNCPKMMARQYCEGCAFVERLYETGTPADEKLAKRFAPKVRVYTTLIDRDNEALGPRIFDFGKMIFDELTLMRKNPRQGGDFTNPTEKGYDIEIYVTGEKMERRYKPYPGQKCVLASPEQVKAWLQEKPSLEKFCKILSPEAIAAGMRLGAGPSLSSPRQRVQEAPRLSTQAATRTLEARAATPPARPAARPARPARDDDDSGTPF